jgi:putative oxidoreductase
MMNFKHVSVRGQKLFCREGDPKRVPTSGPIDGLADAARKNTDRMGPIDLSRWGSLPIRLLVGIGFIAHGLAKLTRGPDAFADILLHLNVPLPHVAAWLTIGTELVGGLAMLLGAFVAWVSIPMAAILLVAIFSVHLPYGFSSVRLLSVSPSGAKFGPVGYEVDLLYLAMIVTLALQGAGPLSIDRLRRDRSTRNPMAMPPTCEASS